MRPSDRQTRAISCKAATGSGNVQVVREETTVSKLLSEKGSASASANKKETSMDNFADRIVGSFPFRRQLLKRSLTPSATTVVEVCSRPAHREHLQPNRTNAQ